MNIEVFEGGFDKNLSYLIWCNKTKIAAIIDPAIETTKFNKSTDKVFNNKQFTPILALY